MRQPFRHGPNVTLDASGNGQVTAGPYSVDKVIEGMSVETGTSTLHPTVKVSINGGFVEGTYSGHRDTSNSTHKLAAGDILTCEWTGGDVGTQATLRIWGTQYPAGQMP